MIIGAQLYTVRDFTTNLTDFSETLKKVADIGYTTVQVSGTCAFDPHWLQGELQKNGLSCVLTHTNTQRVAAEPQAVHNEHQIFGCHYIGIGSMPGNMVTEPEETFNSFVGNYLQAAKTLKALGSHFMFHNHNLEFTKSPDGKLYMEKLMESFAPGEMDFTLDTYWVQAGGGDCIEWLQKLKGRVPCVHLKDMAIAAGEQRMAPIYGGNMNFDGILNACLDAGAKYLLVEQDDCYGRDPFDCLKESYKSLTLRGLK